MARTLRDTTLDTRAARGRLRPRGKPYFRALEEGLHLGYRKPRGRKGKPAVSGKWLARHYVGQQSYKLEVIGAADDFADADGIAILSFSQAQAKARELMARRARSDAGVIEPITVRQAVESYVEWLTAQRKSADTTRSFAQTSIYPHLGNELVVDLTTEKIEKWLADISKAPAVYRANKKGKRKARPVDTSDEGLRRRRSTANRRLTVLKAALNRAWRARKVPSDEAWRRVQGFKEVDAARLRYLSLSEAVKLTDAATADFAKLIEGGLQTGARYGELCRLDVADFAAAQGTVHVRSSKSGKARRIELTDEGIQFFTALCADRDPTAPMFIHAGGRRWKKAEQSRPMKEACKAAGLTPAASFIVLRHTWASHAVMNGAPLLVVAKNLGHSTTRMVEKHYGHLAPSYVRDQIRERAPRFRTAASNVHSIEHARSARQVAALLEAAWT